MTAAPNTLPPIGGLPLLVGLRWQLLKNRVRQTAHTAPLRLTLIVFFILAIWATLYVLFDRIFAFLHMFPEQSVVALPYIFHIFFVAMTILLAFSSAILAYGGLFIRREPAWLLSAPLMPISIVAVVFFETLFFASWSLLLLGFPMMLALGRVESMAWYFYPTFIGAFLVFVPIPGALGLFAAWAAAMWMPRSARRIFIVAAAVTLLGVVFWWARLWGFSSGEAEHWLNRFLGELQYLRSALLPSTWVTMAIRHALYRQPAEAVFYLFVTAANALFLGWLAIHVVGRWMQPAFGHANAAPVRSVRIGGRALQTLTDWLFAFLPRHARCLLLKDLRAFVRDPLQWSQLAILFGLLSLYLLYLPRMHPPGFNIEWQALICFLNYGAVTLILSTFTSRFVFPMVSLEGRQMWLLGLWPLARSNIIWAKFDFAIAVTAGAALVVTGLSIHALELPWMLGMVQLAGTLASCVGLCGLAIGLGARMPTYNESSAARIASGLGGTVNLIASMVLVLISLAMMGALCYRSAYVLHSLSRIDSVNIALYLAQIALGFGVGSVAMRAGVRHFSRAEF